MTRPKVTQGRKGSREGNATLTEGGVRGIRAALADGISPKELSELWLLSIETIRRIGRRESWSWVQDIPVMPDMKLVDRPLPPATEEEKKKIAESLEKAMKLINKK